MLWSILDALSLIFGFLLIALPGYAACGQKRRRRVPIEDRETERLRILKEFARLESEKEAAKIYSESSDSRDSSMQQKSFKRPGQIHYTRAPVPFVRRVPIEDVAEE
uniref:Uncharacterized protein n=1 Tax=Steinernema glaseri TaxID=37863 RepID=A0A1I7ZT10_9BILA